MNKTRKTFTVDADTLRCINGLAAALAISDSAALRLIVKMADRYARLKPEEREKEKLWKK